MSVRPQVRAEVDALLLQVKTADVAFRVLAANMDRLSGDLPTTWACPGLGAAVKSRFQNVKDFNLRTRDYLQALGAGPGIPLTADAAARVRLATLQTFDAIDDEARNAQGCDLGGVLDEFGRALKSIVAGAVDVAAPVLLPAGALLAVAVGVFLWLRFG